MPAAIQKPTVDACRDAIVKFKGNRAKASKYLKVSVSWLQRISKSMDGLPATTSKGGRPCKNARKPSCKTKPSSFLQSQSPHLSAPTAEMWERRAEVEVRNQIAEYYLPIVTHYASVLKSRLPANVSLDDMIQVGRIGLMKAIVAFDSSRGFKFETYCQMPIRGAMLDELRETDDVPRLVRVAQRERRTAEHELRNELGCEPSAEQITTRLGWTEKQYRESLIAGTISLSHKARPNDQENKQKEVIDSLAVDDNPAGKLDADDNVRELLKSLSVEQFVMMYLLYWKKATMKLTGEVLGISESRVSQVHSQVIVHLKQRGRDSLIDHRHEWFSAKFAQKTS